jgi:hypothetical protein
MPRKPLTHATALAALAAALPPREADAAFAALAPAAARYGVPDRAMPGLQLQVMPSAVKSWALYYRSGARLVKYTLGRFPYELGTEQARAKGAQVPAGSCVSSSPGGAVFSLMNNESTLALPNRQRVSSEIHAAIAVQTKQIGCGLQFISLQMDMLVQNELRRNSLEVDLSQNVIIISFRIDVQNIDFLDPVSVENG